MIKRFLNILIFLMISLSSFAQKEDNVSFHEKLSDHYSEVDQFLQNLYSNPSLQYFRFESSLTNVYLRGLMDDTYSNQMLEQGRKKDRLKFNAESYLRLNENSRVWGEAFYQNGRKENVLWNETSDYEKIYPYFMADTLGGGLSEETYSFKGGYCQKFRRWTFGASLYYRALLEFRNKDPRPLNSIAELQGSVGISYTLSDSYALTVFLNGEKYKQNDQISYFNELGVSKTYHLLGLGTSYRRFDGTNNQVAYQGYSWRTGLDLIPVSSVGGLLFSGRYDYSFLDKILTGFNSLSLNDLKDHTFHAQIGWLSKLPTRRMGIVAKGNYSSRNGHENIYGDSEGNSYPLLSRRKGFIMSEMEAGLKGFWEMKPTSSSTWYCGTNLQMGYRCRREKHLTSSNKLATSSLQLDWGFQSTWQWRKDIFRIHLNASFLPNLSDNLQINTVADAYARNIISNNFNLMKSDQCAYQIGARWTHLFGKMMCFVGAEWGQHFYFERFNGQMLDLQLGLSF